MSSSAEQAAGGSERLALLAALLFTPPDFILGIFIATLKLGLHTQATLVALWLRCPLCLALLLKLLHRFFSALSSGYSPRARPRRVQSSSPCAAQGPQEHSPVGNVDFRQSCGAEAPNVQAKPGHEVGSGTCPASANAAIACPIAPSAGSANRGRLRAAHHSRASRWLISRRRLRLSV